jgi:hypothetical protein
LKKLEERRDFDLIYPSHADLPISREIIPDLISAAEDILAGRGTGKLISVHNTEVMAYDAGCSVLLCEKS